jgi:hypothetical protein
VRALVGLLPLAIILSGCALFGIGPLPDKRSLSFPHATDVGVICRDVAADLCDAVVQGVRAEFEGASFDVWTVEVDGPLGLVITCGARPPGDVPMCSTDPIDRWADRTP